MRQPLVIEVFGEYETGKTELVYSSALKGFNSICFDTTPSGEAKAGANKYFGDKGEEEVNKHWIPIRSLEELRVAATKALREGFNVMGIDTTADLQDMAVAEWLDDMKKDGKPRDRPQPWEYGVIRDKIDAIIRDIVKDRKVHLVLTSKMKDEYKTYRDDTGKPKLSEKGSIMSYETGRRSRDGLDNDRIGFGADIRLYLRFEDVVVEEKDDKGKVVGKRTAEQRRALVFKNRFCSREGKGWIQYLIGDKEINWDGIFRMATIPVELGGDGIKDEYLK